MKFVIIPHSEGSVQVRKLWQQVLLLQGNIQDAAEITPTFGGVTARTVEGLQ